MNPYSFLYCSIYRFLENKTQEKDRISFAVQSFIALALIIYLVITFIVIKTGFKLSLDLRMNKLFVGVIFTLIFYLTNYLLFDRKNRYIDLLNKYTFISRAGKILHSIFWLIVLITPLVLNVLSKFK